MIHSHTVGADEVAKRMVATVEPMRLAVRQTLQLTAEEIMGAAKDRVPVRDGPLRASGYVAPVVDDGQSLTVEAGFSAIYALPTHENPRAGKTGGVSPSGRRYTRWAKVGEWKFLETPFKAIAPKLGERLRQAMARVMGGPGGAPR